jgi:hypothetical protein
MLSVVFSNGGWSDPEAGWSAVQTVRGGGTDDPCVRRISYGSSFLAGFVSKTHGISLRTDL